MHEIGFMVLMSKFSFTAQMRTLYNVQVREINHNHVMNLVKSYQLNVPDLLELTVVPDRGMCARVLVGKDWNGICLECWFVMGAYDLLYMRHGLLL